MKDVVSTTASRAFALCAALTMATACDMQQSSVAGDELIQSQAFNVSREVYTDGENCFKERIVQSPRQDGEHLKGNERKRKVPKYLMTGPWADQLDFDTLAIELNQKDIDWEVDLEDGHLSFSNPGNSRAVIDVFYCLNGEVGGGHDDGDSADHDHDGDHDDNDDDDGDGDHSHHGKSRHKNNDHNGKSVKHKCGSHDEHGDDGDDDSGDDSGDDDSGDNGGSGDTGSGGDSGGGGTGGGGLPPGSGGDPVDVIDGGGVIDIAV